jgi:hypothetical protein
MLDILDPFDDIVGLYGNAVTESLSRRLTHVWGRFPDLKSFPMTVLQHGLSRFD